MLYGQIGWTITSMENSMFCGTNTLRWGQFSIICHMSLRYGSFNRKKKKNFLIILYIFGLWILDWERGKYHIYFYFQLFPMFQKRYRSTWNVFKELPWFFNYFSYISFLFCRLVFSLSVVLVGQHGLLILILGRLR